MNVHSLVKTTAFASLFLAAVCQAGPTSDGTSSNGAATGKHQPLTVSKSIDKASPARAERPGAKGAQKGRLAYRKCPDGTMIHPGEKCPEKRAKK